jgi:voltage-gated potassium channel
MARRSTAQARAERVRDDSALSDVQLPTRRPSPARQVSSRVLASVAVMLVVAALVWIDRAGYRDGGAPEGDPFTFLDAVYYSTVSLSTTGYGDITPVSDFARLFNIIVITPLRILFLALLVGTTLEVLTQRTRAVWRENRWRQNLLAHTVVVGYGVKGRAAANSLLETGTRPDQIVVIDKSQASIKAANDAGFAGVLGDGTRQEILEEASIPRAARIIVATDDDSRTAMVVLTARKMNRTASIVASVRENENADLIEQSGASTVITGAESAGRLLGIAAHRPQLGAVVEDLLEAQSGLELVDREVAPDELGRTPGEVTEPVMGVVRQGVVYRFDDPAVSALQRGDHLVVARSVNRTAQK